MKDFWIVKVKPVINYKVIKLCKKAYYNHPDGCPNLEKKKPGCPPTLAFPRQVHINAPIFAIFNQFNFKEYCDDLRKKRPNWTERQVRSSLWWQSHERNRLERPIRMFLNMCPSYLVLRTPEATGVDVTATMKTIGISLEWPPMNYAYQVVLAGLPVKVNLLDVDLSYLNNLKEKDFRMGKGKKLIDVAEKATEAFWAAVKKEYPDIDGSLPDNLEMKFHVTALKSITAWKQ